MNKKITYINLFIAFLISLLIIYFIPSDTFLRYKADILNQSKVSTRVMTFNSDLDSDEKVERVVFLNDNTSLGDVLFIRDEESDVVKFWISLGRDKLMKKAFHEMNFINDYDKNGQSEIYFFTIRSDSAFLNIIKLTKDLTDISLRIEKFVDRISFEKGKPDVHIGKICYHDVNKDGYDEVVFGFQSGYSIQPRAVYIYDIKNDVLKRSPFSSVDMHDFKYIRSKNIFLLQSMSALGNTISPTDFERLKHSSSQDSIDLYHKIKPDHIYKYGDFAVYTLALDTNLNYLFKPIEYPGYMKHSFSVFIKNKIYSLVTYQVDSSFVPFINVVDLKGQIVRTKKFPELKSQRLYLYRSKDDLAINCISNNNIMIYDTLFNLKKTVMLDYRFKGRFWDTDIDNDGENEFISINDNNIIFYRNDFGDRTLLPINYFNRSRFYFSRYKVKNDNLLDFLIGDTYFNIRYYKNDKYYLKYLVYLLIFMLVYSVIFFIYSIQKRYLQKKYEKEKEFNELQLMTIKQQISPHFIFNALNAIGSIVYMEEKETAYDIILKFSKLIRATLMSADKISRSLNEEIEFVENYLELEEFRFKEKFEYKISVDSRVDREMQVPRMCIQTYVENAIKHGLMHKQSKGHLRVDVKKVDGHVEIIIRDDGIGREDAKKQFSYSTGRGFSIMQKTYMLYRQLTGNEIKHEVVDLYDDQNVPCGTMVKVLIENYGKDKNNTDR